MTTMMTISAKRIPTANERNPEVHTTLKRNPSDASPLGRLLESARALYEGWRDRGVDVLDQSTANNAVSEAEIGVESARLFSDEDAEMLEGICILIGEHATDDESAGSPAPGGPALAAAQRHHPGKVGVWTREYIGSVALQREFGKLGTFLAFRRAEASGRVRSAGRRAV